MKQINKDNTVIIYSNLDDKISVKRHNNIVNNKAIKSITKIRLRGITEGSVTQRQQKHIYNLLNHFKSKHNKYTNRHNNYDFGIIIDDDFEPHENFLTELNITINLLPRGWRTLHLCPGFLWGRGVPKPAGYVTGMLQPTFDISNLPCHPSNRFFTDIHTELWKSKKAWLGGPIAFVINKNSIKSYIKDYQNGCLKYSGSNNDIILFRIANELDFICKDPLLGYESPQGGGLYDYKNSKKNITKNRIIN